MIKVSVPTGTFFSFRGATATIEKCDFGAENPLKNVISEQKIH
jgi:hypothetical protein